MQIKSVQEYITLIEKLKNNYTYTVNSGSGLLASNFSYRPNFIFRGHGDHQNYKLKPQIFRWKNLGGGRSCTEYSQLEYNILKDFTSEACRYLKDVSVEDIPAWLEIAQHFGAPTRLLDFTENPLVALYFACSDAVNADASVWILDRYAYNQKLHNEQWVVSAARSQWIVKEIVSKEIVNRFLNPHEVNQGSIPYPWIYKPFYREERMNQQSSIFMIWGAQQKQLTDFFSADDYMTEEQPTNVDHGIICYVEIPANRKETILQQLNLVGINNKFIYPGIDGVGKYIKTKYSSTNFDKGNTI